MKKIISILVLIFMIIHNEGSMTFALEGKVVSDSNKQSELMKSFNEVNHYTDNFFTPKKYLTDEEIAEQTVIRNQFVDDGALIPNFKTLPPVKKLRLMMYAKKHPELQAQIKSKQEENIPLNPKETVVLNCEFMEYFAERTELEATGDVVVTFPQNDTTLKADKLIYNQSSNVIKAINNVVVVSNGQEMKGDYLLIDLNEENAFLDKPITDFRQIHCIAKKGFMYGDKIIQEQGGMYITDHMKIDMRADMFGPDLDRLNVDPENKAYFMKENHGEKFRINTKEIVINAKKEHDTVQLKHATIYFADKKVGTIPRITLHTNKNRDFVEGDFPELGTLTNMGLYVGPGFVFDTPRGSTLKVVPMFNYQSGADSDHMFGFGGIGKFKSSSNKTDFGYGTTNKTFIMTGIQYLDDNLYLQYGANRFIDDWFMGYRMPRLMGELIYQKSYSHADFLAKNKDLIFTHRVAGGYMQDGVGGLDAPPLGEDGIGSFRAKYMAEVVQTLFRFNDEMKDTINARFDIISQGAFAFYGTGDTQFIGRIGPRLHSQYKNWMQDAGYFLSAYDDNTPFIHYDKYYYGRSNVYLRESFRLFKYLTLSWMGSLNLSDDAPNKNMLQECTFFFGIGPDDVRLNIGYDIVRQQAFITMAMHLDAKGSSMVYDKMVIKNPERLGKYQKPQNEYFDPALNKLTSNQLKEGSVKEVEYAQVDDIIPEDKEH